MKAKDLINLSNEDLRKIFTEEDWKKLPSPVKEFVEKGADSFEIGTKINRATRIAMSEVTRRFIQKEIN